MDGAKTTLEHFGVTYETVTTSAHRNPQGTIEWASSAEARGLEVVIAAAGYAAHLAGVIAGHTILPVIGVPIDSSPLNGLDSLLSTVMMPSGVPVATVTIGSAGAKNAAVLAVQILARSRPDLQSALRDYKVELAG